MALIFPSNPTLNQVYSTGSLSWTWNGKSWNNGTSILATSNLVSSSVQFTNGNTNAFDTNSNITVGQITASFAKISGSIFGTASFATNAFSASYAPNIYVLPTNVVSSSAQLSNGGAVAFDTNSNITVNQITASFAKITNLTVEYVTSSVMVITGSNKFGDASNDKQEFTGSVSISGSLSIVGNVTSNNVLSLASGTVSLPSLILSTDTTSGMYRIGANNIGISISAAKVLDISSTGLSVTGTLSASGGYNGTVGATTASTGAFTTLSASGKFTSTVNGNGAHFLPATGTSGAFARFQNTANDAYVGIDNSTGTEFGNGNNVLNIYTSSTDIVFYRSGEKGRVTSTGLAVTGTLSTTSTITQKGSGAGVINLDSTSASSVSHTIGSYYNTGAAFAPLQISAGTITSYVSGSAISTLSSTGLAVTGALSATGKVTSTNGGVGFEVNYGGTGAGFSIVRTGASASTFTMLNSGGEIIHEYNSVGYGFNISTARVASISSTGLSVTGTLSSTTSIFSGDSIFYTGELYVGASNTTTDNSYRILNSSSNLTIQQRKSGTWTSRMTLDTSGNLLVGTTSQVQSGKQCITFNGSANNGLIIQDSNDTANGRFAGFNLSTGSSIGSIERVGSTSAVVYNTTSDYRLKDITGSLTESGTFIDALKPRVGTWKSDGSKFVGFVAHEFAEVCPSSVSGEKDAVDAEGNPKYQGMQASSAEVIANLVAELQSVRQRLAALEAK